MKAVCLLLTLACAAATAHAQNTVDVLDCHFAPGWEQTGVKRSYAPDNLYDYKDGGAEGYLAFGFVRMQGVDCKSGGDSLSIDISEMTDADAAYGMFTANRDATLAIAKIGMGAQIQPHSLLFAKGRYYVEVAEIPADAAADHSALMQAIAAKIEPRLEGSTALPETLSWFPAANLVSASLVPESVLGMRLLKRGYVAKYAEGQAFIVLESTPESAAEVIKKLREKFATATPAQVADEALQTKDKYLGALCIFRKGRYVAGYANLPDQPQAAALATQLSARIP
jgi:hypothetical protein